MSEAIIARIHVDAKEFVPKDEREFFEEFMVARWRHSPNTRSSYTVTLRELYEHVGMPMLEVTRLEAKAHFKWLNERDVAKSTKVQRAAMTRCYVDAIVDWYLDREIIFANPFPRKFDFTAPITLYRAKNAKGARGTISDDVVDKLLCAAQDRSFRDRVLFLILKRCGMRPSEVRSIRIDNVDTKGRMIITGLEHGCRKTNKTEGDYYLYFIPVAIVPALRQYMTILSPGETWLFPGKMKGTHLGLTSMTEIAQRYSTYIGHKFEMHEFRRTIITKRLNSGCPLPISHILVNQECGDVQLKSYYREQPEKIRDLFDKWDPYR